MNISLPPRLLSALVLLAAFEAAPAVGQPLAEAAAGRTVTVQVPISAGDRPGTTVRWEVRLAPGVASVRGPLEGVVGGHSRVDLPLHLALASALQTGVVQVAMLRRGWSDGASDSIPIILRIVPPAPAGVAAASPRGTPGPRPVPAPGSATPGEGQEGASIQWGGLTREVEVELYGSTRSASPGSLVVLRYTLNSYEDADARLRLKVEPPPGWVLLDRAVEEREFLLEGWESIEGEIRLAVPRDTRPGSRHRVRVDARVEGEPGGAAVLWPVQVVRRGALRPGAVGLSGTASLQASNVRTDGLDGARVGSLVELSGALSPGTTLSVSHRQGPRENLLTNFRIPQEETRWSAMLRGRDWLLQAGNQVAAAGSALVGPYVRGRGGSLRRSEGRLTGDLTVVQPTSYVGDPGGRLVRGSFGVGGRRARLGVAFSDFERPAGGYSTAPRYPEDIDPDSLERLEREREALARSSRNRVQGGGMQLELRSRDGHALNLRGGMLRLGNAGGDTVQDLGAEAYYAFNHRRAQLSAGWRRMPPSLDGVHLAGDAASLDASAKLVGDLRLAGRGYRSLTETLGGEYRSETEGGSLGVRYYRGRWRMDLRGNYREWSYSGAPTVARTGTLALGIPLGALTLGGYLERGTHDNGTLRRPSATYRGDLRWQGRAGMASASASYYETLNSAPRTRADLLGSVRAGEWELAGGAWATRGWLRGGEPGFWTQLGVPVAYDLLLSVGVEHAPPTYAEAPAWLGSVGFRKNVAIPVPFLRNPSGTAHPAP